MAKWRWIGLVIGVLVATTGFGSNTAIMAENNAPTGVMVGEKLPSFTVSNRDGEPVSISPGQKPMVINFWATWCPPCRAELPELAQFAREQEGVVQFYGINLQEAPQAVEAFLEQQQVALPVAYDRSGEAARLFAIRFIPTTIVADEQGTILFRKSGAVTAAELNGVLKK